MLRLMAGNALREPKRITVNAGGVAREVRQARVRLGNQTHVVFSSAPPISLSMFPSSVEGRGRNYVTTNYAQATPTGGQGPFTYAWSIIAGSAQIASPSNALTYFSSYVAANEYRDGTARCTVTDSNGKTASADLTFIFIGTGNGGQIEL